MPVENAQTNLAQRRKSLQEAARHRAVNLETHTTSLLTKLAGLRLAMRALAEEVFRSGPDDLGGFFRSRLVTIPTDNHRRSAIGFAH